MIAQLYDIFNPDDIRYEAYDFYVYAVLDGVKYPMLWSDLEEGVLEYDILFKEEKLRTQLESVAPFLVKLDYASEAGKEQTKALLECYGHNWCIFFATPLGFEEALERTREIFYLYGEEGELEGVLRFYEPLIFSNLLLESSEDIQRDMFAKIYCYWCEEPEVKTMRQYFWDKEHIRYKTITVEEQKETINENV